MVAASHEQAITSSLSPPESQPTILYEAPSPDGSSLFTLNFSEKVSPALEDRKAVTDQILGKIVAPYNAQERQLKHLLKLLERGSEAEEMSSDQPSSENKVLLPLYSTFLGMVSFPELVEKTRKYAAYVLNYTYHMSPADVEDGLQAGYMHLWKRLQNEPNLLKDKSMAWIGKGIIYKGLHATRGDWRYRQHIVAEEGRSTTDQRSKHSLESRATDVRTDIHRAIAEVAQRMVVASKTKRSNIDFWALYGLTMLGVSARETSRLFDVREGTMQLAYQRARKQLQIALPHYAPRGETKPVRKHGREKLPEQDIVAIRRGNKEVTEEIYQSVQTQIENLRADTWQLDRIALMGIRQRIPVSTQARNHHVPQYRMQRAYKRVHLMIGAERDPSVRTLRPERRFKTVFLLTAESAAAVERLAWALLKQPKSYEKLVALHAHIGNLAISTTAKHFNIPTSTLRYYAKQITNELQTLTQPAWEQEQKNEAKPLKNEGMIFSWEGAAD